MKVKLEAEGPLADKGQIADKQAGANPGVVETLGLTPPHLPPNFVKKIRSI